jgi:hypothetical protein
MKFADSKQKRSWVTFSGDAQTFQTNPGARGNPFVGYLAGSNSWFSRSFAEVTHRSPDGAEILDYKNDAIIVYPALGETANVGIKTLSQFVITFDQQHERVRFIR